MLYHHLDGRGHCSFVLESSLAEVDHHVHHEGAEAHRGQGTHLVLPQLACYVHYSTVYTAGITLLEILPVNSAPSFASWEVTIYTFEVILVGSCDCRWQSCVLQFTVYVGPGGSFSPSPTTQEQPLLYFPRLSSFCSHFLLVALSSLLSMPNLQTF